MALAAMKGRCAYGRTPDSRGRERERKERRENSCCHPFPLKMREREEKETWRRKNRVRKFAEMDGRTELGHVFFPFVLVPLAEGNFEGAINLLEGVWKKRSNKQESWKDKRGHCPLYLPFHVSPYVVGDG